jgi:AraC-like DNA-binding protein
MELHNNLRFLSELTLLQIEYMKFVDSGEIRTILEHIQDQRETFSPYSRMLSKIYYCELFICLSKIISETRDEMGKLKNQHVTSGLDYLVNSYSTNLSVEEIARHVGISPRHFSRLFVQELGMNVQEYLTIYRIKKAKELLSNSDMDITQIAYSLGFNSSQYFTTCFKRMEHVTPKTYRHTARPENRL